MTRRWPALVLVAALLVAGLVLADDPDRGADDARPTDPATLLPVAAPADAGDVVWFCAGQTAGDDTVADGTVVVANVGDEPATGHIEVVGDTGDRAEDDLEIPARTTRRVRVADLLEADWAAVRVETEGGTVVVEHEVVGPQGRDVAPCQTTATDRAVFPSGATTRDATLHLAVYNPYLQSASIDVTFTTTDALRRAPGDFRGMPVPARSLVVLDITPVVTVVPVAAATITTRRGRIVADRIQTYDGEGASSTEEEAAEEAYRPEGLTVTPAVPAAGRAWAFPAGGRGATVHERVVVRNLTDDEAEVDVDDVASVPEGVAHSLVVRSTNGVPVVAERWIDTAGADASYVGVATSTGSPVAAPRWAFAAGRRAADEERQRLAVLNPGDEDVEVTVVATGDGEATPVPGGRATIAAGQRWEIDLEDVEGERFSLVVEADGPVVAERRLLAVGTGADDEGEGEQGRGASIALGIPLPPGLRALR